MYTIFLCNNNIYINTINNILIFIFSPPTKYRASICFSYVASDYVIMIQSLSFIAYDSAS